MNDILTYMSLNLACDPAPAPAPVLKHIAHDIKQNILTITATVTRSQF